MIRQGHNESVICSQVILINWWYHQIAEIPGDCVCVHVCEGSLRDLWNAFSNSAVKKEQNMWVWRGKKPKNKEKEAERVSKLTPNMNK